ncbi:MAG: dihydrolipoyllysine-residue succinyltransferase [Mariprofundaceae bacterium]|nr:dihydrolipoyllysine-residue succinyltransferase [Mariprofundaceae bacterium]
MDIEIKVPSLGESENEATLIAWLKKEGEAVEVDDVIAEIESDKITMEITAFESGVLKSVYKEEDSIVTPGEVIAILDTSASGVIDKASEAAETVVAVKAKAMPELAQQKAELVVENLQQEALSSDKKDIPIEDLNTNNTELSTDARQEERLPMSRLRKRMAKRLKASQNTAAMLTTFNEVNMQTVMDLRTQHKDAFAQKHGVKLGFMSFFVKACAYAARQYPAINAYIDGEDIVYHNYMDVGVAVSTDKGLLVPVLRDAGLMSYADIEKGIVDLASKARDGGLMPDDLKGGTFSITNGGVFGSMLSTPILNAPQSAILGMHAIQKRVVVEHDQMVIRPMMYLALSYDHRLIDGKEAVSFLVAVKSYLEQPGILMLDI